MVDGVDIAEAGIQAPISWFRLLADAGFAQRDFPGGSP
jgi:hypothetical protein